MASSKKIQPRKRGRPLAYDWALWTNGKIHEAVRRRQFACQIDSFCSLLRKHGTELRPDVDIEIDGDTVKFQFLKR